MLLCATAAMKPGLTNVLLSVALELPPDRYSTQFYMEQVLQYYCQA